MAVTSISSPQPAAPSARRNAAIVGSVIAFHVAALWALQSGLVRRTLEIVVPVAMLSEIVTPPKPVEQPAPPPVPQRVEKPVPKPAAAPAPIPLAVPQAPPSATAPMGVTEPPPVAPPLPVPIAAAPVAPPPPPKVELPSSSAEYLQNPAPTYPQLSKRLGEQGRVIVRVQIGVDGRPLTAEVKQSSGYERLDRAAVDYVMKCRYVPGKVGGVPREMWHEAPVNYVLQ